MGQINEDYTCTGGNRTVSLMRPDPSSRLHTNTIASTRQWVDPRAPSSVQCRETITCAASSATANKAMLKARAGPKTARQSVNALAVVAASLRSARRGLISHCSAQHWIFRPHRSRARVHRPKQSSGGSCFGIRGCPPIGKTACASCHPAPDWGADRRRFSRDARGELTSRQSPTVFNSMTQPSLRWLGDR